MKTLVTGGAGFIGSHLCELLLEKGHHVEVIDDLSTGSLDNIKRLQENPNFKFHLETILNQGFMEHVIRDVDTVYHLAAAVGVSYIIDNPLKSIQINVRGTENILEIAGLGKACEIASLNLEYNFKYLKQMRDMLEQGLIEKFRGCRVNGKDFVKINGHLNHRLPNTLSISFMGIEANKLLLALENEIAVSAGAACHSEGINVS